MQSKNEKLAEFLGFTYEKNLGWYDNNGILSEEVVRSSGGNCFDELLFDKSWDWLIPAISIIGAKVALISLPEVTSTFKEVFKGLSINSIGTSFERVCDLLEIFDKNECWR